MNQFPEKQPPLTVREQEPSRLVTTARDPSDTGDGKLLSPQHPNIQAAENLQRLMNEATALPTAPKVETNEFDVQAFVRASFRSPKRIQLTTPNPSTPPLVHPPGAVDPYVDPAELANDEIRNQHDRCALESNVMNTQPTNMNDPMLDSSRQPIHEIDEIQRQLEQLESDAADFSRTLSTPTVEVIGADTEDSLEKPIATTQPPMTHAAECVAPSVAWFAEPTPSTAANPAEPPQPRQACPIVNAATGETIYDVRDFSDCAEGSIDAIPGAFKCEPKRLNCQSLDKPATGLQEFRGELHDDGIEIESAAISTTPYPDNDQVFIAGKGDVIEVNGADGFSHIDLAYFDIRWATFSEHVIQIDDQQGAPFEIHYQDVAYALFADNVEVRLDVGDLN